MSGYTKVDNWLFDVVMPKAKPNTFKVVAAVERKTAGWGKKQDKISLSQFKQMTGIANRTNLCKAIQDALDAGYIERVQVGNTFAYSTNSTETVPPGTGKQYRNSTTNSTETVPLDSTETVLTKEYYLNNKLKEIDELANWFADHAGIFGRRNNYQDEWIKPLAHYIERGRGIDGAQLLIERALVFARGDNETQTHYTVKNPASLSRIIANMNGTGPPDKVKRAADGGAYL